MSHILSEARREVRWAISSRLLITLVLTSAAFAAWSAATDVGNARSAAAQFKSTASSYAAAGESVEEALAAPLNVTTNSDGQTEIDNPVRFDFESATESSAAMLPVGASVTALSLALFVFIPAVSYAVGLFAATADLRSGSMISRWPQVRYVRIFVSAKFALLTAAVLMVGLCIVAISSLAGLITAQLQPVPIDELPNGAQLGMNHVLGLFGALCLIGVAFTSFGFLVATITRERVFSLVAFVLAYYLLPILGVWDIRNLIPTIGQAWLSFYGGFQPRAVGDVGAPVAALVLVSISITSAIVSSVVWSVRDKTPANL